MLQQNMQMLNADFANHSFPKLIIYVVMDLERASLTSSYPFSYLIKQQTIQLPASFLCKIITFSMQLPNPVIGHDTDSSFILLPFQNLVPVTVICQLPVEYQTYLPLPCH